MTTLRSRLLRAVRSLSDGSGSFGRAQCAHKDRGAGGLGESLGWAASHRVHRHRRDVVREPVALAEALQRALYREDGGEG
jgi:hypothetical protein